GRASGRARAAALRGSQEPQFDAVGPGVALVLAAAVIGGLSYGVWSMLIDVQKVSPDAAPPALTVAERLDPLAAASVTRPAASAYEEGGVLAGGARGASTASGSTSLAAPLDGPLGAPGGGEIAEVEAVLAAATALDSPQPGASGRAAPLQDAQNGGETANDQDRLAGAEGPLGPGPRLAVRAVADSWMRIRDRAGRQVFMGTLAAGDVKPLPISAGPYSIRAGNAGGVVVSLDGVLRGPLGPNGRVVTARVGAEEAAKLPRFAPQARVIVSDAPLEPGPPSPPQDPR
ncbi:MAG: DUF4115 domain-containing protein, partial [Pseudomonadota bacterium]